MIQTSEIEIKKLHRKCWRATFQWWDDEKDNPIKINMEYDAPTEERLKEKIEHFKATGILLRDSE